MPAAANPHEGEVLQDYICERCGYKYQKNFDYKPFLCYRCIRYIAKKVFVIMNTIQPPLSAPEQGDV